MKKLDTLESSIEKLLNTMPVYNEPVPAVEPSGFMQKMGKKMITDEEIKRNKALSDFGYNQNSLNMDFIRAFLEMKEAFRSLEKRIESESADFQKTASAVSILKKELDSQRLRSTLNSNQIEKMDASLYKYTEKLESYALSIEPGIRNADCPKGCVEADISDVIGYYDKIENAKKSSDMEEFEKFCSIAMSKSMTALDAYEDVVIDFYGNDKIAALLYTNLTRNSIYKIKLLKDGDIPNGKFSVICTDNAFVPRKLMLKSAVVLVTGSSPFAEVTEEEIENLRFLNDCGLHSYITLSELAYDEFKEQHFRNVKNIAVDKIVSGNIVKLVEKAMESAVPSGAVSYTNLKNMLEGAESEYITDSILIEDYINQRSNIYPYNCLNSMEKSAAAVIKNKYFPKGTATCCRVNEDKEGRFEFVDGLNYINHLNYEKRKAVYERVKNILDPNGIFFMNACNSITGIKIRALKGWNYYPAYEAMWTREQIINELEENGFKIKFLIPVGAGLYDNLPPKYRKTPVEWIIGAIL